MTITTHHRRAFFKLLALASLVALLAVVGALIWQAQGASAAGITVNSTADNLTAGDSNCTLREAIGNANSNSDTTSGDCTAGSGADTITLPAPPPNTNICSYTSKKVVRSQATTTRTRRWATTRVAHRKG